MPQARHTLSGDGEEVHIAAWPDSAAQARDIARFIALEGRVFVGSWLIEPRPGEEGLVIAAIEPARIAAARHSFDPTGHNARPDVFSVSVDRRPQQATSFTD